MKKSTCIRDLHILGCFILAIMSFPSPGIAEQTGERTQSGCSNNVFMLGEIEVYGEREPVVNVTSDRIYAKDLRLFNADNLAEAADRVPGVTMAGVGARNEQAVFVRGFDIKHVPLFLDGIPIYVPYDGYPDLGRFTTYDISEIVVSKGFTSVLYGPNAMGGAINMVSRKPTKAFEGDIGAGYGTGGTYRTHVNLGTNQGAWYIQAGGSYVDSDYFRLSDDFDATVGEDGGKRENSYCKDEKASFKIGFTPGGSDEYALSYIRQHGEKGVPPYAGTDPSVTLRYWQWPYWNKESVYFTSRTGSGSPVYLKTTAYYDRFWNSLYSFDDDTYSTITRRYAFKSNYNDRTFGGSIELGTSAIRANLIKLSLRYKNDIHKEWNEGEPILTYQDFIYSVGIEDTITLSETMHVIAGASYDTVDTVEAEDLDDMNQRIDFEKERTSGFNPQIGLFYTLPGSTVLHAAVSKKTRMPSIKDKYSYRLGYAIPNPDLDPEESINYEAGCQGTIFRNLFMKATVFHNDISDYIITATVPDPDSPGTTIGQNQNIGKVSQYGAEIEVSGSLLDSLDGGMNYTYLHVNNKTSSDKITGIPQNKAGAYLRYKPATTLSGLVDVRYATKRYSSTNGVRTARAYTVVDLKLMWEPLKNFTAETGIDNVFDRDYALDEGYPQPGRSYFANVNYRF